VTGRRPDDWTLDKLREMGRMADKLAANIAHVVQSMTDQKVDALSLQARKKYLALNELETWSEFDLPKALNRQAPPHAKNTFAAESSRKSRRK
jgi:hypothetical protein